MTVFVVNLLPQKVNNMRLVKIPQETDQWQFEVISEN